MIIELTGSLYRIKIRLVGRGTVNSLAMWMIRVFTAMFLKVATWETKKLQIRLAITD